MKAATVAELKKELSHRTQAELLELCLRLSKFKKENKELLTYLLYEFHDEEGYIVSIKREIDEQFLQINTSSYHYIKKSVRRILRTAKKYIRYSKKKETEIEILLHFCAVLKNLDPPMEKSVALHNIFLRQIALIRKIVTTLHEDLQYDFNLELEDLD